VQAADLERLKEELDDILAVVKKVPTELQDTAFRVLLERWLDGVSGPSRPPGGSNQPNPPPPPPVELPQQFRTFMRANGLTDETVSKVYHPLGQGAQLVVSDLPGSGKAGKEINLALLTGIAQALNDGIFKVSLEDLRNLCVHYDCYDASNFTAHLRNNKLVFKTYKKGEDLELSGAGMKRAAELVKSIAASASS
jgi:hypothetical protein